MITLYTADLTDNHRFAAPVTAWQRGFEDATYEQTYANPSLPGTPAYAAYDDAFRQAAADCRHVALGATLRRRPTHH